MASRGRKANVISMERKVPLLVVREAKKVPWAGKADDHQGRRKRELPVERNSKGNKEENQPWRAFQRKRGRGQGERVLNSDRSLKQCLVSSRQEGVFLTSSNAGLKQTG